MKYVIANWKMNIDFSSIESWFGSIKMSVKGPDVIVCPSSPYLHLTKLFAEDLGVKIGAQDVSKFENGNHTGDTGAFQLKDFCKYCIVGHSERKENIEDVKLKILSLYKIGITPIICFRNAQELKELYNEDSLMAWEDPNNISEGGIYKEKNPKDIEEGIKEFRKIKKDMTLIYGGSVNTNNVKIVAEIAGVDGVLVGNASLDAISFTKIVEAFSK